MKKLLILIGLLFTLTLTSCVVTGPSFGWWGPRYHGYHGYHGHAYYGHGHYRGHGGHRH